MIIRLPRSYAAPAGAVSSHSPSEPDLPAAMERPARLVLVNLMPDPKAEQRRFERVFARAARRVELIPLDPAAPDPCFGPDLEAGVTAIDGLVITGAPFEGEPFEAVPFWPGLVQILDQAVTCGLPGLFVGWAAQAALYHRHGIEPSPLPAQALGVVEQEVLAPLSPYLAGVGRRFSAPVVRRTKVRWAALAASQALTALATSPRAGLSLIEEPATRSLMLFDPLEFEADELDIVGSARSDWSYAAGLLFGNWLGEAIRRCRAAA